MTADYFHAVSPYIMWWSIDRTKTVASQDELDSIYGEKGSGDRKFTYKKPNRIYAYEEINPILIELSRLGIEQIEEITLVINVDDFLICNFEDPKAGDIFRLSRVKTNTDQEYRNIFYEVSSVVPFDYFNSAYLNFHLYCEQVPLQQVPQEITNFMGYL